MHLLARHDIHHLGEFAIVLMADLQTAAANQSETQ